MLSELPDYENLSELEKEEIREESHQFDIERKKKEKTTSLMNTKVNIETSSLLKIGIIGFVGRYNREFSYLVIITLFLSIFLILLKAIFFNTSASEMSKDFDNIYNAISIPIIKTLLFIKRVLFEIPETAYPFWSFVFASMFFTWLFGRTKDVIGFMYLKGDRNLKMVLFRRFFDTAGHQYIAGQASFMYRLFFGNPRYPLDEYYHNFIVQQTAELDIIEVANGRNLERQWTGTILIIQTDPTDDIDDDKEIANILLIVHTPIEGSDEYKRTVKIDKTKVVPFVDFQSMILGEQLRYKDQYAKLKKELHVAYVKIDDLQIDLSNRLARDLNMTPATRTRLSRGESNPAEEGLDELDAMFEDQTEQLSDL